jgi:hypothetical protein
MKQEILTGVITKDAYVKLDDGRLFEIGSRGLDDEGYQQVLMDATSVGGSGFFQRQSIKPYIGMKCEFVLNEGAKCGFNFKIK